MCMLIACCEVEYSPFFRRKEDVVKMTSVSVIRAEQMWQFVVLYDKVTKRDGI